MTEARPPLSLAQQADLIDYTLNRCIKRRGDVAAETWMLITPQEYDDLRQIEARLRRMSKHESQIRNLVTRG